MKQVGLSPDGPEVRAVKSVMKLSGNSLGSAKITPTEDARPSKPVSLKVQCM